MAIMLAVVITSCSKRPVSQEDTLQETPRVVVGYVTSWGDRMPDPALVTHYNYAFGHVTDTFDSVRIDNPDRLRSIVALKESNPDLKVMVSVGGWGSGRFSEMAASEQTRKSFAANCMKAIGEYGLDGIDIDWEYPGTSVAKISSAPTDTENYTLMMRDIRAAIGPDKILSQATVASAKYINFADVEPYVDYTNVMTYDMGDEHTHNSPLHRSAYTLGIGADEGLQMHLDAGIPASKIVMGMSFGARGAREFRRRWSPGMPVDSLPQGYSFYRDMEAGGNPCIIDSTGVLVMAFEDTTSIRLKSEYALQQGFKGAMFWCYEGDTPSGDLRRTIYHTFGLDK